MFPIDIDFSRLKEVLTYDLQAPMIFSSGIFLWLFAAFMVVYVLLQRKYTARPVFARARAAGGRNLRGRAGFDISGRVVLCCVILYDKMRLSTWI